MTHMLADNLRSEFLATPQLVRFDMAYGAAGLEPTLLLKANSLALKYLLRRQTLRLIVTKIGSEFAYGIEIPDDPASPGVVWSVLQGPKELEALITLTSNPRCVVFLFNEVVVSVAWTELEVPIDSSLSVALRSASLRHNSKERDGELIGKRLDEIHSGAQIPDTQILSFQDIKWNELKVSYVTNRFGVSHLSLFSADEGGQQEEIAVWLTDNLDVQGCVKNAQVHETRVRELSDILLTYENGAFLIESKTLNILLRENLPDRDKLARDLVKDVEKGRNQLAGGIKNLRRGLRITDESGREIEVEREKPAHAIILVPDLSLLQDATQLGPPFLLDFMQTTGGYLHILDPAELLRMVQAAEMIARDSERLTKMMAFDWYLMERAKRAVRSPTPDFAVLFRKGSSAHGGGQLDDNSGSG